MKGVAALLIKVVTCLTIFKQREVRSILVLIAKRKSQKKIFSDKDAKICHFHSFSEKQAGSASMTKVECCVMLELFWKKLLILKVIRISDCFSQNRSLKSDLKYSTKSS